MATHSSILVWRTSWTEQLGRLQPWGHKESDTKHYPLGFSNGSMVGNPPTMQETQEMQVRSLGREDPLEKDMTTY